MVYFKYSLFELPIPIATDPAYGGDLLCSDLMPDISLKFQKIILIAWSALTFACIAWYFYVKKI